MTSFYRSNPNLFANNPLDRVAHRRTDAEWIDEALASTGARLAVFNSQRQILIEEDPVFAVKWMKGAAGKFFGPDAFLVFLGVAGAHPYFALGVSQDFDFEAVPLAGRFFDLRAASAKLAPDELAIVGLGAWLLDWHARHGFCAKCGAPTPSSDTGWKRVCGVCRTEHFPRVDPVAIMLATRGDRCLLGRQAMFPSGMYSALAGFVEPGETVEEACVRELLEEAGIQAKVEKVRYLFAQPWPFPSSLMFGLHVEAETEEVIIDTAELEHARWFTRAEIASMRDGGLHTPEGVLFLPPGFAVARHLIEAWLDA